MCILVDTTVGADVCTGIVDGCIVVDTTVGADVCTGTVVKTRGIVLIFSFFFLQ